MKSSVTVTLVPSRSTICRAVVKKKLSEKEEDAEVEGDGANVKGEDGTRELGEEDREEAGESEGDWAPLAL